MGLYRRECFDTGREGACESELPELVKSVPHLAFEVDNLTAALEGQEILIAPNSPSAGVTVAFIVSDGAPVGFLQIDRTAP